MNKLLITRMDGRVLTALTERSRVIQLDFEDQERSLLGNIYIGKVKNIAKNIHSAFIDIGDGQMGYYSLSDNPVHHFTSPGRSGVLKVGDEIVVQVARDAVKTKDPVLTGSLSFTGRFCVLTAGKRYQAPKDGAGGEDGSSRIGFSTKIKDQQWKQKMRGHLLPELSDSLDVIIRTNAYQVEPEVIVTELKQLKDRYCGIIESAAYRTCYSMLLEAEPSYIARLRDTYSQSMEEIVTDDAGIYEQMKAYLTLQMPDLASRLKLYQDSMVSMTKLYQLEKFMDEALSKHVWLKSGGYLVIEPTEAMTVIDVNTGRYTGKKNLHDTIMKINLEAAEEISRQMRLRNLSGIILVDFIDMEREEDQKLLLKTLSSCCAKDPVKTTVVDITRLNLVEITRKKIRKPFYEQMGRRS